jgi:AcrR family transcriptional regulator
MPKQTFLNLPDAKRERINKAAIAEFAVRDYPEASLDRIAAAAEVPKGSLYQYFDDKEDCYRHAVRTGVDRAAALFEESLRRRSPRDCWDLFRRALLFVVELRDHERELALLYARAGFVTDHAPAEISLPMMFELAGAFHARLLDWGIAEGRIDPSLDRKAAGFLIDALSTRFHSKLLLGDPQYGLAIASRRTLTGFASRLTELLRRSLEPPPTRKKRRIR